MPKISLCDENEVRPQLIEIKNAYEEAAPRIYLFIAPNGSRQAHLDTCL
jgi:hypothetical protein